MRRITGQLREKAVSSVRRSVGAFNSPDDDGRHTAVLLHLQHASEMTLKAALSEKRVKVFGRKSGRSIGFDLCLSLSTEHLRLSQEEVGTLRTIDALRDDEQHWLSEVSEELLYLHSRATIGVIDEIFRREFDERLADFLPDRALPLVTKPLKDFDVLVNSQYDQIVDLLQPERRKRSEARAKIRGLLSMEGHVADEVRVSEQDVNRVEKAIRAGKPITEVFPRLLDVGARIEVDGPAITVHFTKREGAPVHFIPADAPDDSAAVRQVDLQKKYHRSANELASALGITSPKATALRRHLRIDENSNCVHTFNFGESKHIRYSDNAFTKMRDEINRDGFDLDDIWEKHRTRRVSSKTS